MSDSIWNKAEYKEEANTGTKYLSKLPNDIPVTLTFTNLVKREQSEKTPEVYRTDDGTEFVFFFQDEDGNEKEMTQKSASGKFFKAMRSVGVEPGEVVTLTKSGSGIETEWKIEIKEKLNPLL